MNSASFVAGVVVTGLIEKQSRRCGNSKDLSELLLRCFHRGIVSTVSTSVSKTESSGSNPDTPAIYLKEIKTVSEAVDTVERKSENRNVGEFVSEVREELTRVSFPSRDDVRNTTIIVVLNVIFFAVFLFLVDQIWVYLLQGLEWLINKASGI